MRIIIIDDEQPALDSIIEAVKEVVPNAQIDSFRNPVELLTYVQGRSYDVAFLDIRIRGMSGIELAKQLKLANPTINIIFVTGYDKYMFDAFQLHASGYLMKPTTAEAVSNELQNLRRPAFNVSNHRIQVQTFGNFEVFCNGTPIKFLRSKSKEVFAFLVDKHGTMVTPAEIASIIWEDGIFDRSRQKQMQNYICDLQKSLSLVNAEDIIIKNKNGLMVDKTKFECDLYRFFEGDPKALNSYTGQYMFAYSWAEITAAFLTGKRY